MLLAMWHLRKLTTALFRSIPAFFRSRNEQALIGLARRQQLATYTRRDPKPRITPVDRAFWAFLSRPSRPLAQNGFPAVLAIHFEARSWSK